MTKPPPSKSKYKVGERVLGVISGPLCLHEQFPAKLQPSPRFPHLELERIAEIAQINSLYVYRLKSSSVLFFEDQVKRI